MRPSAEVADQPWPVHIPPAPRAERLRALARAVAGLLLDEPVPARAARAFHEAVLDELERSVRKRGRRQEGATGAETDG